VYGGRGGDVIDCAAAGRRERVERMGPREAEV